MGMGGMVSYSTAIYIPIYHVVSTRQDRGDIYKMLEPMWKRYLVYAGSDLTEITRRCSRVESLCAKLLHLAPQRVDF